ncbi:hypothetical protein ABFX02_04G011850 [Erythranthe guttata]
MQYTLRNYCYLMRYFRVFMWLLLFIVLENIWFKSFRGLFLLLLFYLFVKYNLLLPHCETCLYYTMLYRRRKQDFSTLFFALQILGFYAVLDFLNSRFVILCLRV